MKSNNHIKMTLDYVKNALSTEGSGHDWWHIYRVWSLAKTISKYEGGDLLIIELSALLHDIADWKFNGGDFTLGAVKAREWLESIDVNNDIIEAVCEIISNISFKGAQIDEKKLSLEGKIVQDADRLDAMGAIGIARAFAYGGAKNRLIYDPDIKPVKHDTIDSYLNNPGTSINHFYEKLLILKDRINTNYAKKIAEQRHFFMENFLEEFFNDWNGKKYK